MECDKIRKLLSDYLDNELGPEKRKIVESHIARCQACAGEFAKFNDLTLATGKPGEVSPPDFAEGVQTRIEAKSGMERFLRLLFYPPYIKVPVELAAICATVLIAFYVVTEMGLVKRPVYVAKKEKGIIVAKEPNIALWAAATGAARFRALKTIEVPEKIEEAAVSGTPLEAGKEKSVPERKAALMDEEKEQLVVFSCLGVDKTTRDISIIVARLGGSFESEEPGLVALGTHKESKGLVSDEAEDASYEADAGASDKAQRPAPLTKSLSLQIPADRLPAFLATLEKMGTIISMPPEISPRVLSNVMSLMGEKDRALLRQKTIAVRLEIRAAQRSE